VVADASEKDQFSNDAWTTAQEIKWWRKRSEEQRAGDAASSSAASVTSSGAGSRPLRNTDHPAAPRAAPGPRSRRAPSSRSHPGRSSR